MMQIRPQRNTRLAHTNKTGRTERPRFKSIPRKQHCNRHEITGRNRPSRKVAATETARRRKEKSRNLQKSIEEVE